MLEAIILGALIGLLMASVFVSGGALIFAQYMTPESTVIRFFNSRRKQTFTVLLIIGVIYVLWSVLGIIHGAVFVLLEKSNSMDGLGSPNLIFTVLTLINPIVAILIITYKKKSILVKALPIILIFAGMFGWMIPYTLS
ncbi:MAG: hypothetical protein DK302_001068 [Chloroflexi bacterium]|jgi:hypothetical protein|nr:MAG: hypothetical protein DK302_001068 [Chloroflexota bacterium]